MRGDKKKRKRCSFVVIASVAKQSRKKEEIIPTNKKHERLDCFDNKLSRNDEAGTRFAVVVQYAQMKVPSPRE